MKTRNLAGCAALLTAMLLGGCAMAPGEDLLAESRAIAGEDLRRYFHEPETGKEPVLSLVASDDTYTGTVDWWTVTGGTFEAGKAYTAVVKLQAASGYDFTAAAAGRFFHSRSTKVFQGPGSGGTLTISIYFNAIDPDAENFVVDYDLQRYVPIPVAGAAPVKELIRPDLKLTARWMDGDGTLLDEEGFAAFAENETYQAELTLTAQDPYRFKTDCPFVYPPEAVAAVSPDPAALDAEERILFVTYHQTAGPKPVEDGDLTLRIPAPVAGAEAARDFGTAEYTGTVVWKLLETDTVWTNMPGSLFQPEALYRADVALYTAPGFTLGTVEEAVFSHSEGTLEAGDLAPDGSSLTGLKIAFPMTGKLTISDRDLTQKVPRPVRGEIPPRSFYASQYTGEVLWEPEPAGDSFEAKMNYKAVVTLNAEPGYTFAGVETAVFFHSGAGTVVSPNPPSDADSRGITIAFPATEEAPTSGFGPADLVGSALNLMEEKKSDEFLPITLSPGTEDLVAGTVIQWTDSGKNTPRSVAIDGRGRTLRATGRGGKPLITLEGNGSSDSNLTLTLKNITIKGKTDLNAPLVKVTGGAKLILGSGAVLEKNYGGAVHVDSGSFLEMGVGSVIRENHASATDDNANPAGGVYVGEHGTFTMKGGVLSGNEAASQKSAGAVYVSTNGVFIMTNGDIAGNTGAGMAGAGGLSFEGGTFTMNGGRIRANTVAGRDSGGGVYVGEHGTFTMNGGEISGNTAADIDSAGGVRLYKAGFTMNDGVISGNNAGAANSTGGVQVYDASFTMNNGSISGNTAGGATSSGGVMIQGSAADTEFKMHGGKIINNTVSGAGTSGIPSAGGVVVQTGKFTMTRGEISNNTAAAGYSGGGVGARQPSPGSTSIEMTGGIIFSNTARGDRSGGGVSMSGGTFTNDGGQITENTAAGDWSGGGVSMSGGSFTNDGGQITENTAVGASSGGGVSMSGGTFTNDGGQITENTAAGDWSGGGVSMSGGTFTNDGSQITNNTAGGTFSGGGVSMSGGSFTNDGSQITENTARGEDSGGGVSMSGGSFTNDGGQITKNTARGEDSGGGVSMSGGTFTNDGSQITENTAAGHWSGGGVSMSDGTFTMRGSGQITNNTTNGTFSGGGVSMSGGSFTNDDGQITENTAAGGWSSGGVYMSGGAFTLSGSGQITNNTTNGTFSGGGVSMSGGSFTNDDGQITENTAAGGWSSGGVYMSGGAFTLKDGEISQNTGPSSTDTDSSGGVKLDGRFASSPTVFSMTGGAINNNTVNTPASGGGVFMIGSLSRFTMSGGTISDNQTDPNGSTGGGGVYVHGGRFEMTAGAISNNKVLGSKEAAGGVCVVGAEGFFMGDGISPDGTATISGNTVAGPDSAGGVRVANGGIFEMKQGSSITDNAVTGDGNGAVLEALGGNFIRQAGEISGNTVDGDPSN